MKLSEKIYSCRKKLGLSQEGLAQQLGISRQAVSKWETGESEPDIQKLRLLAKTFGVSVDWLLAEDEEEPNPEPPPQSPPVEERLPAFLRRMVRRYGWLAGVYLALYGGVMLLMGGFAHYMDHRMFAHLDAFVGGQRPFDPVRFLSSVIMGVGGVLLVAGILLALWLKKRSRK